MQIFLSFNQSEFSICIPPSGPKYQYKQYKKQKNNNQKKRIQKTTNCIKKLTDGN